MGGLEAEDWKKEKREVGEEEEGIEGRKASQKEDNVWICEAEKPWLKLLFPFLLLNNGWPFMVEFGFGRDE